MATAPAPLAVTHGASHGFAEAPSVKLQELMERAANDFAAANAVSVTIRVQNTEDASSAFAVRDNDAIVISPGVAAQAHSRMEYLALVAVVIGHLDGSSTSLQIGRPVDPTKVAAALAVAVTGSKLDKVNPNETDPKLRNRQSLQWQPEPMTSLSVSRVAAARTLAMLAKAGGCSAPLVTVLKRIADRGNAGVSEPARRFARGVITDLGAAIYPPDQSCLSR